MHGAFGLLAVGEQNDRLAALPLAQEPQFYTAPNKIESFKDLFNVPAIQRIGESSHLYGCLIQQAVDLQLLSAARPRPRGRRRTLRPHLAPPALLTLLLLTHFVALEVLATDRRDLDVPAADVHAVLAQHHFRELGGHLQHCLARELAVLEDEAHAVVLDVVALGLDHALHQLIFRDLERQPDAPEVREVLAHHLLALEATREGHLRVHYRLLLPQLLQEQLQDHVRVAQLHQVQESK